MAAAVRSSRVSVKRSFHKLIEASSTSEPSEEEPDFVFQSDNESDGEAESEDNDQTDTENESGNTTDEETSSENESNDSDEENNEEDSESQFIHKNVIEETESSPSREKPLNSEHRAESESVGENQNNENVESAVQHIDEYSYDSSDEEDLRNTVGNIPMNWYDEYKHIGYDLDGRPILKPQTGDELDKFLRKVDDPDFWRTIRDPQTGQDVVLTDKDVEVIQRLNTGQIPNPMHEEYTPWVNWFSSKVLEMPIKAHPPQKRSFIPSKVEARMVSKMVDHIRRGWIKPKPRKKREERGPQQNFYMLWDLDSAKDSRKMQHIPAPRRVNPGHRESYNPPSEYLFTKQDREKWDKIDPDKRKQTFVPEKFRRLRDVPSYTNFTEEQFNRCLDLYLAPRRMIMKRKGVKPEHFVPQLPSPKDLQPFPTVTGVIYKGHKDLVRSISVEDSGQFLVSGSDDHTIKFWEVTSGRCLKSLDVGGVVRCVSWCRSPNLSLVAACVDRDLFLIIPGLGDKLLTEKTEESLSKEYNQAGYEVPERVRVAVQWEQPDDEQKKNGICFVLKHFLPLKQVVWHAKGDYFATLMPDGQHRSVVIHHLSKRRSQLPFQKSKGLLQWMQFHPIKPWFFVATQNHIRIYNLVKQELKRTLMPNCKWISSFDIHPGGDNVIVGTYDRKALWFDLDLSSRPYKTLRINKKAIRMVGFHKKYPLFATAADDGRIIISHGMVYDDLLKNPLIVPLKILTGHKSRKDLSVLDVEFHPTQPWIFSAGADTEIRLYS